MTRDDLDRCPICGWRLADEEDHRAVPDPYGEHAHICEHCAACRELAPTSTTVTGRK